MKNTRIFIRKFSQFLEVKFSIYLDRRVFVMGMAPRGPIRGFLMFWLQIAIEPFCFVSSECFLLH